MRLDTADQEVVAIAEQVMRGNGRRYIRPSSLDVCDAVGCRDMFQDNLQSGKLSRYLRLENIVDEYRFTVKDVNRRISHFAVQEKRHTNLFHPLEHRIHLLDARYSTIRIGC